MIWLNFLGGTKKKPNTYIGAGEMPRPASDLDGFRLWPGLLDRAAQEALRDEVFARMREGPFYIPRMPQSGAPMSVRMTNFGPLGWVTELDQK